MAFLTGALYILTLELLGFEVVGIFGNNIVFEVIILIVSTVVILSQSRKLEETKSYDF